MCRLRHRRSRQKRVKLGGTGGSTPTIMDANRLLYRYLVVDGWCCRTAEDAIRRCAALLFHYGHVHADFEAAVVERERNHPSGLPLAGPKVAIPHTDPEYVRRSALLFARLDAPVEFCTMGNPRRHLSVSLIAMPAIKERELAADVLEFLISLLTDPECVSRLEQAAGAEGVYAYLQHALRQAVSRASGPNRAESEPAEKE